MQQSAFYSKWSGGATTASAQAAISACYSTFEAFLMDNLIFIDFDECVEWLDAVLKDIKKKGKHNLKLKSHTKEEVFEKLKDMHMDFKPYYEEPLRKYLENLDEDTLSRIYYKNRLFEFTMDHEEILDLYRKIVNSVKIYPEVSKKDPDWKSKIPSSVEKEFSSAGDYIKWANKEAFLDPNDIPDSVKDDVKKLADYYMEYIYVPYLVFDKIYRLKNFTRQTVAVVDTDSNILVLDKYVQFIRSLVYSDKPIANQEFIIVNTITYTITEVATDILLLYGEYSNIPEEFRPLLNMKNEFFMKKLIVSEVKKRYMSLFKLREGNLLNPPKTDIKGFDFTKSATSDMMKDRFTKIVETYLLKADTIDVRAIRKELLQIEEEVTKDIRAGNLTFLPVASAKELEAYSDPGAIQSVRGVIVWNSVYPENPIDLPSKVKMLKLTIFKEEDIYPLSKTHPEIYETLMRVVFRDTTGIFITQKIDKNTKKVRVNVKGVQVISIPSNEKIPEWLFPYIDYQTMVGTIMSPFKSVTDLLKINCVTTGYNKNGIDRTTEKLTNIIKF